ncbi:MAG: M28 family peptidase [Opitutaceae bacterium]|nr:M28 family peptidase [Opitutaceae bacterium]
MKKLLLILTLIAPLGAQPAQNVQDAIVAEVLADHSAYEFLGHLCDDHGPRLTGSAANNAAMLDTLHQLHAMGVEAHLQPFKMPGWVRLEDEAVMVAPIKRKLRAVTLSYVQPHAPFEADVVYLGDGSDAAIKGLDTQGKIGLLAPNAAQIRGGYNEIAQELGLKGIVRTCRVNGGQLLCRTGSFQGEPINVPVYCVTQEEGKWMERSLARDKPVRVRLHTRSYCKEIDTANIVATFPGKTKDTVIIGGHFDSWDLGQGAIDNGIGVAQLFGVAKALQAHAKENLRTVELVWFNGEEQGLWGSRHHAPTLGDRPIAAMVNLDMVGFPKSLNALGVDALVPVLKAFDATLGDRRHADGVANANWFGSDHTPYQLAGIPAITFGAFIDPDAVRYYHDFGDTFDKIDPKMIAESTATIAALTYYLANAEGLGTARLDRAAVLALFSDKQLVERMVSSGLLPKPESGAVSETAK